MGACQLVLRAVALLVLAHNVVASMVEQRHYLSKRGNEPNMPYDFDTIKTCTYWYDNYEGFSCKEIRDWRYAISPEDFSRWNPKVTLDCGNWQELCYCVEVRSEMKPPVTSSEAPTTSASEAPIPTPEPPALLGWTSLGCYTADRTLKTPSSAVEGSRLTPKSCGAACYADGLLFAGLQAGKVCWCNGYVGNSWATNQQDCNALCPGDSSQKCGGANVINFFEAKLDNALPPGPIPSEEPTTPSTTTTSAVATKTSFPAASASPSWQAVGCYKDLYPSSDRTLKNWGGMDYDTMTVAGCHATCARGGYLLAGLENGEECWCANEFSSSDVNVPVSENDCNKACTGGNDGGETCGAGARIYVYKYVVPSVPWVPLGCYKEEYPRILRHGPRASATNVSRQSCIDTCDRAGYNYAGVQFGAECYCDNVINEPGKLAPDGAVGCNMPCPGNPSETCGGSDREEVFIKSSAL